MSIWAQDPSQFTTVKVLKFNNSNSTVAVSSGFDLYRFLQVLPFFSKKKQKEISNQGPADQKSIVLHITPWHLDEVTNKSLTI